MPVTNRKKYIFINFPSIFQFLYIKHKATRDYFDSTLPIFGSALAKIFAAAIKIFKKKAVDAETAQNIGGVVVDLAAAATGSSDNPLAGNTVFGNHVATFASHNEFKNLLSKFAEYKLIHIRDEKLKGWNLLSW